MHGLHGIEFPKFQKLFQDAHVFFVNTQPYVDFKKFPANFPEKVAFIGGITLTKSDHDVGTSKHAHKKAKYLF